MPGGRGGSIVAGARQPEGEGGCRGGRSDENVEVASSDAMMVTTRGTMIMVQAA